MAIEFKEGIRHILASDSCRVIRIELYGVGVFIDGYVEYEELEQILNKMKELREEKK